MTALPPKMTEALRRTRAGDLGGATALIRDMLAGGAAAPAAKTVDIVPTRPSLPAGAARTSAAPRASSGTGRVRQQRHVGATGALEYDLYVPAGAVPGMPLIVMLHGCTQTPEDFARGTGMNRLADQHRFLVAYPRQTQAANAQKCWNWFRPGDQARDQGEPALIAGIVRDVLRDEQANPARVYVAGLSAGGAAAAVMASAYPDLFAGVGVHSGLGCGVARDLSGALTAMRSGGGHAVAKARFVPTITVHGDRDHTVNETNGRAIAAAAAAAFGAPLETRVEQGRSAGGRAYSRAVSVDPRGRVLIEQWTVHGAGHAWSGGDAAGSYTDPSGPDASAGDGALLPKSCAGGRSLAVRRNPRWRRGRRGR